MNDVKEAAPLSTPEDLIDCDGEVPVRPDLKRCPDDASALLLPGKSRFDSKKSGFRESDGRPLSSSTSRGSKQKLSPR